MKLIDITASDARYPELLALRIDAFFKGFGEIYPSKKTGVLHLKMRKLTKANNIN